MNSLPHGRVSTLYKIEQRFPGSSRSAGDADQSRTLVLGGLEFRLNNSSLMKPKYQYFDHEMAILDNLEIACSDFAKWSSSSTSALHVANTLCTARLSVSVYQSCKFPSRSQSEEQEVRKTYQTIAPSLCTVPSIRSSPNHGMPKMALVTMVLDAVLT